MVEQEAEEEKVIHFSCTQCQISLTVDESLAGVSGPCPSCGYKITAPSPRAPQKVVVRPREMKAKGQNELPATAQTNDVQITSRAQSSGRGRAKHQRRSVSPETGVSEAHRERAEVAAVAKMLVAGLVVLAIVLAVAFWLNHRFNA